MIAIATKSGLEKTPAFPPKTPTHNRPADGSVLHKESQVCMCTETCVSACAAAACAGVPAALTVLWKVLLSPFRLVSGSPSPLVVANPSFNANDCHLESNAFLIAAHCLINVKCCVKKYIASL